MSHDRTTSSTTLAPDGPEGLGAGLRQMFLEATFDVRRIMSEGDLTLVHSRGVLVPGTPGLAEFDIFRFQDGKIAEHWDVLQEVPGRKPRRPRPPSRPGPWLAASPGDRSGGLT